MGALIAELPEGKRNAALHRAAVEFVRGDSGRVATVCSLM